MLFKPFSLFILCLCCLLSSATYAAERVALVMGNNNYTQRPLKNPVNDARAIGKTLDDMGFDVVSAYNVNRDGIEDALVRFGKKAEQAKIAVVYYAGHAIQVDGQNFLIPTNTPVNHRRDLRKLINLNELISEAQQARGLGLVILDACRDNPFGANLSQNLGRSIGGRGLARVEDTPSNILVAFATKENAIAADGNNKHSPYTQALLTYLPKYNLEIRLLFGKVHDAVKQATGQKQQPYTYGAVGGSEWFLAEKVKAESNPSNLTTSNATPAPHSSNTISIPIMSTSSRQSFEPEMIFIKGGAFKMGCISGKHCRKEEKIHTVHISDFWMATTEVTVKQYQMCVTAGKCRQPIWMEKGSNYNMHTGLDNSYKGLGKTLTGDNYPIVGVSWHDAIAYAKWLKRKTGKAYHLPTEAEWEYAARAGSKTAYVWGDQINCSLANYGHNKCKTNRAKPVASYKAYGGLYDMSGNVAEWTCSTYKINYDGSETRCANAKNVKPVFRGGGWIGNNISTRLASRDFDSPDNRFVFVGMRLALESL